VSSDEPWEKIFSDLRIAEHDFDSAPFYITADQIKCACQNFTRTGEREVRLLCKQDTRESRPKVFVEKDLFILPVKNKNYAIVKGEGYIDIPPVTGETRVHN
jgi:hypothetical protein